MDMIRDMHGELTGDPGGAGTPYAGPFYTLGEPIGYAGGDSLGVRVYFDPSREVPVGAANKPRGWGALACAFLGTPVAS